MSNELAMLDQGLPAYLRDMAMDDTTKALMGSGGGESKRISVRGGVWRMMVNGKEVAVNEDRAMNVVIAAASAKISRTFYAKTFADTAEPTAPDCWSADGDMPDAKSSNPQSKRCVDCPKNQKGSGQGDSKACRYSQRLAVVLANDIEGDVYQLTLASTSIFGAGEPGKWPLQTYARMLGSKGFPITAVVTEMRFDLNSATPKLTFKGVRALEAAEHQAVIDAGKSPAALRAITMTVAEVDGVKITPLSQPQPKIAAAPKAVVADVEEVEEAAVVAEPVKRSAKKPEAPAEAKDLSKILDEWDD